MNGNRTYFTIVMCAVLGHAHGVSAEPVGIFEDQVDAGDTTSGETTYDGETGEYEITASGGGDGHVAYVEMNGDVAISARITVEASTSYLGWGAYLMVSDDASEGASPAFYTGWVLDSDEAVAHWRDVADDPKQTSDHVTTDVQDGRLKIVRSGDSFSAYYFDINEQQWVMLDSRTIALPDPVYVGIGAWASNNATEPTVARFSEVELTRPLGIFEDHRDIGDVAPGDATYNSDTGEYIVTGSGIETMNPACHWVYSEVSGPVSITAKVSTENIWGAFVGFLSELSENAEYCVGFVSNTGEGAVGCRPYPTDRWTGDHPISPDTWEGELRIVREDDTVSTFYFNTGTQEWTLYDSRTVDFPDTIYVALGAYTATYGTYSTAHFTEVELTTPGIGIFDGHVDIGTPDPPGEANYDSGTGEYQVTSGGQDDWASYHFVYSEVSGNFSLQARVRAEDLGGSHPDGSAALFLRDTMETDPAWFYIGPTIQGEVIANRRITPGGSGRRQADVYPPAENGLLIKIVREGNTVSGYYMDESTGEWVLYLSDPLELTDPVYVGLYVSSFAVGGVTLGHFTEVELTTSRVGIFDGHVDFRNPEPAGDATYNSETGEYVVTGGGPLEMTEDSHIVYSLLSGDFSLKANMWAEDLGGSAGNAIAYLGVFDSLDPETMWYMASVYVNGDAFAMWQSTYGGSPAWTSFLPIDVHGGDFEVVRQGNTLSMYYTDVATGDRVLYDQRTVEFTDPVYVVLGAYSGQAGGVTAAHFNDVELTQEPGPVPTPRPTSTPTPTPTLRTGPPVEQLPILASPEAAGITPLTGDVSLWAWNGGGNRYWRPEADTLSNGNAIVMGGMRVNPGYSGTNSAELARDTRDMIAVFSPSGVLLERAQTAFFTDAGHPWEGTICTSRNDDKFYGLCADTVGGRSGGRYVVHTIANLDEFPDDFLDYPPEQSGQYHTVVQVISNDGTPETHLINPWGEYVSEPGLIRGGMVRFLSNGNIVVNFEDRTTDGPAKEAFYGRTGNRRVVGAVILGPDGSIVKPPFAVSKPSDTRNSDNRFGLTSGDGWFVVLYLDGIDGPTVVAFDNDGNELGGGNGRVFPAVDIPELNGGGGRERGDPNGLEAVGDTLYITHRGADLAGYLTKFRVNEDGVTVLKTIRFPDHPRSTFEHNADLGVDSNGNVIVLWQDQSWIEFQESRWEALARVFNADLEPLTHSFCMFEVGNNTDVDETFDPLGAGRTKQCRIAMNDDIIIAIAHTNELPYADLDSITFRSGEEWFTYTYIARVLANPFSQVAVRDWELW